MLFRFLLFCIITFSTTEAQPCPTLDQFLERSPSLAQFNPLYYTGIWYELAFYDFTQFPKLCGCTHLNWTLSIDQSGRYFDDFTTTCPYAEPSLRKNYTVHMTGTANDRRYPFFIPEMGFGLEFNNTVVYYRTITPQGSYDRAIQYQCKVDQFGQRVFTGINFLSRTYFQEDDQREEVIEKMLVAARQVGIEEIYLNQLQRVQWKSC